MAEGLDLVVRTPCDFPGCVHRPHSSRHPGQSSGWGLGTELAHRLPGGWFCRECLPTQRTHFPERCGDPPEVTQPSVRAYVRSQGPCLPFCQWESHSLHPPRWRLSGRALHTRSQGGLDNGSTVAIGKEGSPSHANPVSSRTLGWLDSAKGSVPH